MTDYYALLVRKISEAGSDPAKMRQVVYEAARLALKRQINLLPLGQPESKRQISELEEAIARLESDVANGDALDSAPPRDRADAKRIDNEAVLREAGRGAPNDRFADQSNTEQRSASADDAAATAGEPPSAVSPGIALQRRYVSGTLRASQLAALNRAAPNFAQWMALRQRELSRRFGAVRDRDADVATFSPVASDDRYRSPERQRSGRSTSRELVLLAEDSPARVTSYAAANNVVFPDVTPSSPRTRGDASRLITPLSIFNVTFQLAVAIMAGIALYVALWGRGPASNAAGDEAAAANAKAVGSVLSVPDDVSGQQTPAQADVSPNATAKFAAAAQTRFPFPLPTTYGIYAINGNRLIELQMVATGPVDPRTRTVLQIVKPSLTTIEDGRVSFIAFRRDFVASAPERLSVRIAARVAKSMNFDTTGKAVVITPSTDTWLIREQGYDLRVSPMPESQEMVMMRPDSADFSFPPGRYELMFGGQPYDFVIAGAVTDSAHCVEGVATVRGPAFYECRQP